MGAFGPKITGGSDGVAVTVDKYITDFIILQDENTTCISALFRLKNKKFRLKKQKNLSFKLFIRIFSTRFKEKIKTPEKGHAKTMIEVKNLTKDFGPKRVVDHVSFSVEKGEILGFLGPNGAGKSTTMRMIMGYIPPTEGSASIGGFDMASDPLPGRKKTGYLPENAPVYPDMTVFEYLDFCARARGFRGPEKGKRVDGALEKCFLTQVKNQTIHTLSKGFKQRVCFAQSILHDPEYLIMDEPTDGLDPNQKHEVRMMIREMSRNKAIVLSTHILEEAESLCGRAVIIAGGRIVADDSPGNLKKSSPDGRLESVFRTLTTQGES
ncbi:putative Sulfate-transporting ATPase [Candidatus Desulfarcum epimagneticum]|uniref:Putative Sulfate-transporting ATPase n=1 Tax=uncultured Desulfobacteraceae bacterium TaxID=218296 RepID=A0A484HCX3_9BACT|nr:putative Sulfate-transporting ATPase [uncultured Desulfobacteraceae bacterium]